MSNTYWFSRVELRQNRSSILALLYEQLHDVGSIHKLLWSLFEDDANAQRDFLFHQDAKKIDRFYILSARKPFDDKKLFNIDEPKSFAPNLNIGDRLAFSLHANPTTTYNDPNTNKMKRCDVVMNSLHNIPSKERAEQRYSIICSAGAQWIHKQAASSGFKIAMDSMNNKRPLLNIDGYKQEIIKRRNNKKPISFSTLDFTGVVEITDPLKFVQKITQGFGHSRAFGCGLMLIRRK